MRHILVYYKDGALHQQIFEPFATDAMLDFLLSIAPAPYCIIIGQPLENPGDLFGVSAATMGKLLQIRRLQEDQVGGQTVEAQGESSGEEVGDEEDTTIGNELIDNGIGLAAQPDLLGVQTPQEPNSGTTVEEPKAAESPASTANP